ncbi:hypothetical protein [Nitratifractor sp.]
MRRCPIRRGPLPEGSAPWSPRLGDLRRRKIVRDEELNFFRHRCEDAWLAKLLEEIGLSGKRLKPSRARKLIFEALRRYREEG